MISGSLSAEGKDPEFARDIRPLLVTYCIDCHGQPDEEPSGEFSLARFDGLQVVRQSPRDWKKVLDALEGYEMPPKDGLELEAKDRETLIAWIRALLAEPDFRRPGKPVLRRLTRLEYNNTVRDLLGLETDVFMFSERLPFDKRYFNPASGKMPDRLSISAREYGARYPVLLPAAGLPGDSRAEHGFSNRGDAQDLSAVRLEQYVELAERICFHSELLSRGERMEELFPHANFRSLPQNAQPKKIQQIVNASAVVAPNDNVTKTAPGSDLTLAQFRELFQTAFDEDRAGVFDASET